MIYLRDQHYRTPDVVEAELPGCAPKGTFGTSSKSSSTNQNSYSILVMDSYTERDIKAILNRASELQQRYASYPGLSSTHHKLTFEDIQEIAKDLGVSADFVREAALEYEGIPVEEPLFLDTGNNYEIELIGFARGELDEKAWTELRAVIESHFNNPGKVKRRLHSIIWKAQPTGFLKFLHTRKSPEVEVSSSNNRSTIRIKKNVKTYNKLLYPAYAALLGAAMMLGAFLSDGRDPAPYLFTIAILAGTAKLFHSWTDNKKQKAREHLKDFTEQLQTIVTRQFKVSSEREKLSGENVISFEEGTTPAKSESATGREKNKTR